MARKWFDGKSAVTVISDLKTVWGYGGTDVEACLYAHISKAALNRYLEANPKLRDEKELLKETPILAARKSVIDGLKDDHNLALKFLERKKKDEFSLRVEQTGQGGGPQQHTIELDGIAALINKLPKNERTKHYAALVDLSRAVAKAAGSDAATPAE